MRLSLCGTKDSVPSWICSMNNSSLYRSSRGFLGMLYVVAAFVTVSALLFTASRAATISSSFHSFLRFFSPPDAMPVPTRQRIHLVCENMALALVHSITKSMLSIRLLTKTTFKQIQFNLLTPSSVTQEISNQYSTC